MSDRFLGIKTQVNSDSVKAGFDEALAASKSFAAGLGADAKAAGAAIDDIAVQADKVSAALRRVDSADSLAKTGKAATDASFQFEKLKEKIAAADAAGVRMGPDIAASMAALGNGVQAANTKVAGLKDTMGDVSGRSKLLAGDIGSVGAASGSLTGMMGALESSGTGVSKGFAEVGLKGVAMVGAFTAGYEAGNKLRDMFKQLSGQELPSLTNALVSFFSGVKDVTGAFDHTGIAAKSLVGKLNEAKLETATFAESLGKLVPELAKVAEGHAKAEASIAGMTTVLDKVTAHGNDLTKWAKENAEAILVWWKNLEQAGVKIGELSPRLQALVAGLTVAKDATYSLIASYAQLATAQKGVSAELDTYASRLARAAIECDRLAKSGVNATEVSYSFNRALMAAGQELDDFRAAEQAAGDAARALAHELERGFDTSMLSGMTSAVEQAGASIFDTDEELKRLIEEMDTMASDSRIQIYLNQIMNDFKSGAIGIEEMRARIQSLRALGGLGGGFLGDISGLIQEYERKINEFIRRQRDGLSGLMDPVRDGVAAVGAQIEQTYEKAAGAISKADAAMKGLATSAAATGASVQATMGGIATATVAPGWGRQGLSLEAYRNQFALGGRGK